jgi:hypothetical protein
MTRDPLPHFRIVPGVVGSHIRDVCAFTRLARGCRHTLSQSRFSAAGTAENQCEHLREVLAPSEKPHQYFPASHFSWGFI